MKILLKISGEALGWDKESTISQDLMHNLTEQLRELLDRNIKICVVLGGGNIYRGKNGERSGIGKVEADYMGMLATILNGVAFKSALEKNLLSAKLVMPFDFPQLGEKYIVSKAKEYMNNQNVVISVGGTGNPFFTTDTAGVLRALELECDMMIKVTKVDGVYDKDPLDNDDAIIIKTASYNEVIKNNWQVMDMEAVAMAREGNLKLKVINLYNPNSILNAATGGDEGTTIL